MTKKRKYIGISLLIAALLAIGIVAALPYARGTDGKQGRTRDGCLDQLTEEQREALHQKMQELRDAGATPEEIRDALQQFMEELGIDIDITSCGMRGFGHRGAMEGCLDQLTEEQREALHQKMQEMRDAGATPEEIKEALQQFMEELGIDIDITSCGMRGFGHRGNGGCFDQLTEEQKDALHQKMQEMRDAGATPEEIKEAVEQFMEELGINMENCRGMKGHRGQGGEGS